MLRIVLSILACSAFSLMAAELTLPSGEVSPGASLTLAVGLASQGATLAGLQADLEYDPDALDVKGSAGAAAKKADKRFNESPAANGRYRMVIIGLNQKPIEDGEVIVLNLRPKANAAGRITLRLKGIIGTDANGKAVPMKDASADITVRAGPHE